MGILTNGITNGVNVASNGWFSPTFATAPTLSASTDYVLGYITDGTRAYVMYDTGDANQGHLDTSNDYTTPTNPTDATHSTDKLSIYVTYTASGGGNSAPTAPTALLAEGQTNPTDISDSTPEFSAIYNDPDAGDQANKYRIQVATTSAFTSTFWDSGTTTMATTTAGARSPDISYSGSALASSTTYYWRMAFTDDDGAHGIWSTSTASFTLAATSSGNPLATVFQDISYTYDAFGNITNITDRSDTGAGKVVVFGYDDLHRLTAASTTAASSTPYSQTYSYNAIGNLTNKSDIGSYTYAGTNYANPHASTTINGSTYTYDNNGNLTSGGGWTYGWNYRDRLASAGNGTATTTYGYDYMDQRAWKKIGSTATTTYVNKYFNITGASSASHVFLPDGSLVATVDVSSSGGGAGSATSTGFKTAGTINESTGFTGLTTSNIGTSDNTYATSFTTNPLGRISSSTFGIPGDATITGIEVTLEAKRQSGTISIPISLSWDNGSSFTSTKSNTITTTETVHTYGGTGDTWGRSWTPSELADANFQVKIDPPTSTFTVSYDQVRTKVYYTTAGSPGTSATTTAYIHSDHLGGANVLTNASGTAAIQTLDYYPFGSERIDSGTDMSQRQYIGEMYDEESSMSYLNSRYYQNSRGQFLSQDPMHQAIGNPQELLQIAGIDQRMHLTDPQALNSYSYARNNPIIAKDPEGELFVLAVIPATAPVWGPYAVAAAAGVVAAVTYIYADLINPDSFKAETLKDSRPFEHQTFPSPKDSNDFKDLRSGGPKWEKWAYLVLGLGVAGYGVHEQRVEVDKATKPSTPPTPQGPASWTAPAPTGGGSYYSAPSQSYAPVVNYGTTYTAPPQSNNSSINVSGATIVRTKQ